MKRSQINFVIEKAKARLEEFNISLPLFAYWTKEDWKKNRAKIDRIKQRMLGWDVTDFGTDDFAHVGAVLFTVRNGDKADEKLLQPYAEKYLIFDDAEAQEIPLHYHISKTEDIVNRAGGILVVEMYHRTADDKLDTEKDVDVYMDGIKYTFKPGEKIEITPGNSITIEPFMFHKLYAKKNAGMLVAGEVSKVNDDNTDNVFYKPLSRFSGIVEDAETVHPLVNEYDTIV